MYSIHDKNMTFIDEKKLLAVSDKSSDGYKTMSIILEGYNNEIILYFDSYVDRNLASLNLVKILENKS